MKSRFYAFVCALFFSGTPAFAQLGIGDHIPLFEIRHSGEISLIENEITYIPWQSQNQKSPVYTLQVLPARRGADEVNKPFIEMLQNSQLPEQGDKPLYQTINIMNLNDSLFGTQSIARGHMERRKKEVPHVRFVIDENGKIIDYLGLKEGVVYLIVINQTGDVIYFNEGGVSHEQATHLIKLIRSEIASFELTRKQ